MEIKYTAALFKKEKKGVWVINASLIKLVWKPTEQRGEKALLGDC